MYSNSCRAAFLPAVPEACFAVQQQYVYSFVLYEAGTVRVNYISLLIRYLSYCTKITNHLLSDVCKELIRTLGPAKMEKNVFDNKT